MFVINKLLGGISMNHELNLVVKGDKGVGMPAYFHYDPY